MLYGSKSGHLDNSKITRFSSFPQIFAIFDDLSEICSTFGILQNENSLNTTQCTHFGENEEKYSNYYSNGCFWNEECSQCIGDSKE